MVVGKGEIGGYSFLYFMYFLLFFSVTVVCLFKLTQFRVDFATSFICHTLQLMYIILERVMECIQTEGFTKEIKGSLSMP